MVNFSGSASSPSTSVAVQVNSSSANAFVGVPEKTRLARSNSTPTASSRPTSRAGDSLCSVPSPPTASGSGSVSTAWFTVNTIDVIVNSGNTGDVSSYPTANGENDDTPAAHTRLFGGSSRDPATGSPLRNRTSPRPRAASRRPSGTRRHNCRSPPLGTGETSMFNATRDAADGPRLYPAPAPPSGNSANVTSTARSMPVRSNTTTSSRTLSASGHVTVTSWRFTL